MLQDSFFTHPAHTEATSRLFNDVYFFHRKMIFKMYIDRLYIRLDFKISESIAFQEAVEIDVSYPKSFLKRTWIILNLRKTE